MTKDAMTSERVLLIGGAGFIGSALAQSLHHQGATVTVLDSHQQFADPARADHTAATRYRATLLDGCTLVRGDARHPLDLLTAFDIARPTRVVHLAAVARAPLNDHLVTDAVATASTSIAATLHMCARHEVTRMLLVSSSYVYGDFRYTPCDEDHPTEPRTVYGATKLTAEILTRALAARFDVACTVARLIAVYGPWDLNGKLSVQNLVEAATTGRLPISGGPGEGTDYTHITDAVRGLCQALVQDGSVGATLNIARGHARTADEVAAALTGMGVPAVPAPERVGPRPRRGALSIDRARELIGYAPTVDIEDGLRSCLTALDTARPAATAASGAAQ